MDIISYLRLLSAIINKRKMVYVHFGITHRCNLKCRVCSIWKLADKGEELNLGEIAAIADILKSLGVVIISLGGGEPFLRDDLREVVEIFVRRGFLVRLLTNGTLIKEELLKDLIKAGLRHISVSLDTLSPDKQSFICKQEGIWDRIVNSMELISGLFPKRRSLLLVNTTVSRLNLEELPLLADFVGRLGYYISFIPLEPLEVGHCGFRPEEYSPEFKINSQDHSLVDRVYGQLIDMKMKEKNIFNSRDFLEKSRQFLKGLQKNWACDAGRLYLSLDPQGYFSICHHYPAEKRLDKNISLYLESEDFQLKRKKFKDACPGCMRPCWAEITNLLNDKKSLLDMIRLEISTWKARDLGPFEVKK